MEDQVYEEIIGPDGKRRYVRINIKKLLKGGWFKYFYEKNKQYVKKWKEVLVNRQLFEMWNALPPKEQKVWIDKATSSDKLFAMTNNLVFNSNDIKFYQTTYKYPKKEIRHFEYKSGYDYFNYVWVQFESFVHDQVQLNPTPNTRRGYGDPKNADPTFRKQSFQLWKESPKYPHILKYERSWERLDKEGQQEWHDAVDALEHAYDMFCEKTKITNPEMRVTNADVKDHLSRMWESMDIETQSTWNYSTDDTFPIRHRGVRGLDGDFEEKDFDEEDLNEDLNEEDLNYTLPIRQRGVRGLDGDFEEENFD